MSADAKKLEAVQTAEEFFFGLSVFNRGVVLYYR